MRGARRCATRFTKLFDLDQVVGGWREWKYISVTPQDAAARVARGEAVAIEDDLLGVVGYQRTAQPKSGRPTPCTLTFSTMRAVANAQGEPGEVQLEPWERKQIEKFGVWAFIGDTKAVAVRPRTSEREQRLAESISPGVTGMSRRGGSRSKLGPMTRMSIAMSSGPEQRARIFAELRSEGFGALVDAEMRGPVRMLRMAA